MNGILLTAYGLLACTDDSVATMEASIEEADLTGLRED